MITEVETEEELLKDPSYVKHQQEMYEIQEGQDKAENKARQDYQKDKEMKKTHK